MLVSGSSKTLSKSGGFNDFYFHPDLGKGFHFDEHIFQMGDIPAGHVNGDMQHMCLLSLLGVRFAIYKLWF